MKRCQQIHGGRGESRLVKRRYCRDGDRPHHYTLYIEKGGNKELSTEAVQMMMG